MRPEYCHKQQAMFLLGLNTEVTVNDVSESGEAPAGDSFGWHDMLRTYCDSASVSETGLEARGGKHAETVVGLVCGRRPPELAQRFRTRSEEVLLCVRVLGNRKRLICSSSLQNRGTRSRNLA